jgi:hypothetical protein
VDGLGVGEGVDGVGVGAGVGVDKLGVGVGVGVGVGDVGVLPHLAGLPGAFDLLHPGGRGFALGSPIAPPPGHTAKLTRDAAARTAIDAAKVLGVTATGASSWH